MLIKNIIESTNLPRKRIGFELENAQIAKHYESTLLISVRNIWMCLDLYTKGSYLILDGPIADENGNIIKEQEDKLNYVAKMIKKTILNDVPGFR